MNAAPPIQNKRPAAPKKKPIYPLVLFLLIAAATGIQIGDKWYSFEKEKALLLYMLVQRMIHADLMDKVDSYSLDDALKQLDVPLVVTFVALKDNYTPDGIKQENGKTYLTIRLPYEKIKQCEGSALNLMRFSLLSQIRHLKHLDWYGLYYDVKKKLIKN